jgi:DEAD/DEAH box helicase domain-containing protein
MKVLCFDKETRLNPAVVGWKNFAGMGVSFACAYLDWLDEYRLYTEEDLPLLCKDMLEADVVTGFNIVNFDLPLLWATLERIGWRILEGKELILAKVYDVMQDICESTGMAIPKGWKLDNVAKSNLTICKNGDGAYAPVLYEKGQWGRLATYVIQDVKVEYHLFRNCRAHLRLHNIFITPGVDKVIELPQMKRLLEKFPNWESNGITLKSITL